MNTEYIDRSPRYPGRHFYIIPEIKPPPPGVKDTIEYLLNAAKRLSRKSRARLTRLYLDESKASLAELDERMDKLGWESRMESDESPGYGYEREMEKVVIVSDAEKSFRNAGRLLDGLVELSHPKWHPVIKRYQTTFILDELFDSIPERSDLKYIMSKSRSLPELYG